MTLGLRCFIVIMTKSYGEEKETICAYTDIVSFFNDMPVHEDGVRGNARESECTEKHGSPRDGVLRCNYGIDENMI